MHRKVRRKGYHGNPTRPCPPLSVKQLSLASDPRVSLAALVQLMPKPVFFSFYQQFSNFVKISIRTLFQPRSFVDSQYREEVHASTLLLKPVCGSGANAMQPLPARPSGLGEERHQEAPSPRCLQTPADAEDVHVFEHLPVEAEK